MVSICFEDEDEGISLMTSYICISDCESGSFINHFSPLSHCQPHLSNNDLSELQVSIKTHRRATTCFSSSVPGDLTASSTVTITSFMASGGVIGGNKRRLGPSFMTFVCLLSSDSSVATRSCRIFSHTADFAQPKL